MITDPYIEKDGKKIRKVSLIYIDGKKRLCDGCDEIKICASVNTISGHVMVICKDCLLEITEHF